jgi:hypothetical protein
VLQTYKQWIVITLDSGLIINYVLSITRQNFKKGWISFGHQPSESFVFSLGHMGRSHHPPIHQKQPSLPLQEVSVWSEQTHFKTIWRVNCPGFIE